MSSAWSMPLRALAAQTAVITLIGLGLAATASAAQGDAPSGTGSDKAASVKADASETKSESGSSTSATKSSKDRDTRANGSVNSSATRTSDGKGLDDDRHTPLGEQPVSTADQNSGGANGDCSDTESEETGYFCGTTRDQPSGNGKGDGEAVGKPYQAHQGKADNKNPPGQSENDANNGYECDGNEGIAKGNPAHTSCVPPEQNDDGGGGSVGGVDTVAPPEVAGVDRVVPPVGVELIRPPADAPQVLPGAAVLPATGATAAMTALSAVAFVLLALGSGALLYRRFAA